MRMSTRVGDTEVDKRGQTDVIANFTSEEQSASSSISAITKVTSDSPVASDVNNNYRTRRARLLVKGPN